MLGRGFTVSRTLRTTGILLHHPNLLGRATVAETERWKKTSLSSDCFVKTFIDDLRSDSSATYLLYIYLV